MLFWCEPAGAQEAINHVLFYSEPVSLFICGRVARTVVAFIRIVPAVRISPLVSV